jgi:hypothetical protein
MMTVELPLPGPRPRSISEQATEVRAIVRDTEHFKERIISEHIAMVLANGRTGDRPGWLPKKGERPNPGARQPSH